nr:hypothetical protein [Streptomyces sp. HNM0574]
MLVVAVGASVLGLAALRSARGLHRKVDALTAELSRTTGRATVPSARTGTDADGIRAAVTEALAEERERELAEARAFWAAQESRADEGPTLEGHGTEYEVAPGAHLGPTDPIGPDDLEAELLDALLEGGYDGYGDQPAPDGEVFIPRQPDGPSRENPRREQHDGRTADEAGPGQDGGDAELAAARRRHPSHPDFTLDGEPVEDGLAAAPAAAPAVADHERTIERLGELADRGTPLTDVRQGPLGTLDVYLFEDGTTVCLSPGHPETAGRLCEALRRGDTPLLVGGSGVSGAYTLTFTYGEGDIAYLLADRVIASA